MLENLVLVIGLIMLGTVMRRSSKFPANTADALNALVLYVSLPSIIFLSISKLQINLQMLVPVVIHWSMLILHLVILFFVSKWMKFSKTVFGALVIVTTMGNTAFLGIPIVKGLFGDHAVPYAVLFDQLGSGLTFIIMGAFVLPFFTGAESKSIGEVFKNLFTFPPFVALICGFLLRTVPKPSFVLHFFQSLSATLIPCAMLAVGFQMKYKFNRSALRPIVVGLWLKLMIVPLIILVAVKLIGLEGEAVRVSVLQSGMPPMITAGAMAINANLERELSASLVGYGLIFSFITLSFFRIIL